MKFPIVLRTRLEAELAKLEARVDETAQKLEREKSKVKDRDARLAERAQVLDATLVQFRELERICEIRAAELETLQQAPKTSVPDAASVARIQELERICDIREVAHLKTVEQLCETRAQELAAAERTQLLLLDALKEARPPKSGKARGRLPLMIGIDVELDDREVDRANPSWLGAATLFRKLPEFRERLAKLAGGGPVVFTWFPRADPQVKIANGDAAYAFHHFAEEWKSVLAAGDEIGLHMHPWRWDDSKNRWVQDHGDAAWLDHCVASSVETYRTHFGKPPASYRGGDRFLNDAVVRQLEALGVQVDFSVELMPATERLVSFELGTGVIPDTSRAPNHAYRPAAHDFRQPDPTRKSGLGMMPLTAYAGGQLSPWLSPPVFERGLDLLWMDPASLTHLAFVVRSNIADTPSWDAFVANAESLARRVGEGVLEFTTAEQAWARAQKWVDGEGPPPP